MVLAMNEIVSQDDRRTRVINFSVAALSSSSCPRRCRWTLEKALEWRLERLRGNGRGAWNRCVPRAVRAC